MQYRVLVTGSRTWGSPEIVYAALDVQLSVARGQGKRMVVVHGGATGADLHAWRWASRRGVDVEAFPAHWGKDGKRAGPLRNQRMVEAGADICLAFPRGESRGTRHCMSVATRAGVAVVDFGEAR